MHPNYPITFNPTCLFLGLIAVIAAVHHCTAAIVTMSTANTTTKPGCPRQCGNITIPYPFGIGNNTGCSLNPSYDILCNLSSTHPKPFLMGEKDMFEILEISDTQIRTRNSRVAILCFNTSGQVTSSTDSYFYNMSLPPGSPFSFSSASNKLIGIGCLGGGFLIDLINNTEVDIACSTTCPTKDDVVEGQCSDSGCCQTGFPQGLRKVAVAIPPRTNSTDVASFNPCGYAFVAEDGQFNFRGLPDLNNPDFPTRVMGTTSVAIDWVIGNGTCAEAQGNPSTYPCQGNTVCSDNDESSIGGFKCSCTSGFQGNPYLSPGCSDVDECVDPDLNKCSVTCQNTIGSFLCSCPHGYTGDGRTNGTGCSKKRSPNFILKLCLGISCGILFLGMGLSWIYIVYRKRKVMMMKKKFFQQNGGWLLKEQVTMAMSVGNIEPTKIFTEEELKVATNNFDKDRILGNGGYGTVYKGVLPGKRVVAIKKSKVVDDDQIEQFINEVVILGQINHRNVVKVLGCCLETEVPLLVYEFISKGTLYSRIYESKNIEEKSWQLTWRECLRIASELADALAYLHSAASPPIIHRDIKSMNILLDDDYTAKIADFGASRLIPMDQSELPTLVQGTLGYLDPEYLHSSLLTHKSDVYSFGVLLAELMTRQKPISMSRSEEDRNLAIYFVSSMEQETLFKILDPQWVSEASTFELASVASIARRCLKLSGEDRPTMKEVSTELEAIQKLKKQPQENQLNEGTESVMSLDEQTEEYPFLLCD